MYKLLCVVVFCYTSGLQAVTDVFRNEGEFLAELGAPISIVDYFDTPKANGLSVTFDSQITSVASVALNSAIYNTVAPGPGMGPVSGGRYLGFLEEANPSFITWTMPTAITAIGFTVESDFNEVIFSVGSDSFFLNITPASDNEFFGIVSTSPFSEVTFSIPSSPLVTFTGITIDNLYLSVVPEPSHAVALLGMFAIIALVIRKKMVP